MKTVHKLEFTAGILCRKPIRNFLERLEFEGHSFKFKELKNFLDSEFIVKSENKEFLVSLRKSLEEYSNG